MVKQGSEQMACIYEFNGFIPVVPEDAFVHPEAVLIGDVIIGRGCYIGPCASLRGDFGGIRIGDGANVQDCCVLHSFPNWQVRIGVDGHIGHGAILHGCHIGADGLVGMNAVVMDGVETGESCIIGANSFIKANTKIPARSLVAGSPAKILREVRDQELKWKQDGTRGYQKLAEACLNGGLRRVEPLREVGADRPTWPVGDTRPLFEVKQETSE